MSDEFSVSFGPAIEDWVAGQPQGSLRDRVAALRLAYEKGATSAKVDLAAYLAVRAPATFASISAVLREVTKLAPDYAPQSMADIGSGPGTRTVTWDGRDDAGLRLPPGVYLARLEVKGRGGKNVKS